MTQPSVEIPVLQRLWLGAVIALTALGLWPIWSVRIPALQDYPQHLLKVEILHSLRQTAERPTTRPGTVDGSCDFAEHYEDRLKAGPYSAFFLTTLCLARWVDVETAGKICLSFIMALTALLVLRAGLPWRDAAPRWGLLLIFPVTFSQPYFQGNVPYCLSVPILVLALLDHERLCTGPLTPGKIAVHVSLQALLFLTHPLGLLAYVGLATLNALLEYPDRGRMARGAVLPSLLLLALAVWVIAGERGGRGLSFSVFGAPVWPQPLLSVVFFLHMFTGHRFSNGIDADVAIFWLVVAAIVALGLLRDRRRPTWGSLKLLVFWGVSTVCVFALPGRWGHFDYINARLAAITYVLSCLLIGKIRFSGPAGIGVAALSLLLTGSLVAKQCRLSEEMERILPALSSVPSRSTVLPLVFDPSSPELDRLAFSPHLHTHCYYSIRTSSGLDPYLIISAVQPVHYRPGACPPAPGEFEPGSFDWAKHGSSYDFLIVHRPPGGFMASLGGRFEIVATSGDWILASRRSGRRRATQ